MSLTFTRASRMLLLVVLTAALAVATLAVTGAPSAGAASAKQRAEKAVVKALVHRHGVGTQAKARCLARGSRYLCGYAAVRRTRTAVYAGRAVVNRKMRVRLGREVCTGGGCKK